MTSYRFGLCLALIGALSLAANLGYAASPGEFDQAWAPNSPAVGAPVAPKAPRIARNPYRHPAQAGFNTARPMSYPPVNPAPPPPMYRPITKCRPPASACFQPPCPPPAMQPMQPVGPMPCGPQAMPCGPPPCQVELYPACPKRCVGWY